MDVLSADSKHLDHAMEGVASARIQLQMEATGIVVSRYGGGCNLPAHRQLPVLNTRRGAVEVRFPRPWRCRPVSDQGPGPAGSFVLDGSGGARCGHFE